MNYLVLLELFHDSFSLPDLQLSRHSTSPCHCLIRLGNITVSPWAVTNAAQTDDAALLH